MHPHNPSGWMIISFDIHSFLLKSDCIGSAFNATGTMQCPNCRAVENGVWRLFGSCIHETDRSTDDSDDDDDVDPVEMVIARAYVIYIIYLPVLHVFLSFHKF